MNWIEVVLTSNITNWKGFDEIRETLTFSLFSPFNFSLPFLAAYASLLYSPEFVRSAIDVNSAVSTLHNSRAGPFYHALCPYQPRTPEQPKQSSSSYRTKEQTMTVCTWKGNNGCQQQFCGRRWLAAAVADLGHRSRCKERHIRTWKDQGATSIPSGGDKRIEHTSIGVEGS
jgi:hypothetical protein